MIRLPASVLCLVLAGLLLGSGCASRPDWIEATLVTVDVTGTWRGTLTSVMNTTVELILDPRGARVTGTMRAYGGLAQRGMDGPVEGSVAGDVLRFQGGGEGRLQSEATVNGDEMTGRFVFGGMMPEGQLVLQRVDRAASPPVQRP
jgi:hypothetical protein